MESFEKTTGIWPKFLGERRKMSGDLPNNFFLGRPPKMFFFS